MSDVTPPRIEFPCDDYPIKTVGDANSNLRSHVIEVMQRHAPGFDQARISVRESREGRFQSVTVFITATGEPQLQAIFEDLKQSDAVKMVL